MIIKLEVTPKMTPTKNASYKDGPVIEEVRHLVEEMRDAVEFNHVDYQDNKAEVRVADRLRHTLSKLRAINPQYNMFVWEVTTEFNKVIVHASYRLQPKSLEIGNVQFECPHDMVLKQLNDTKMISLIKTKLRSSAIYMNMASIGKVWDDRLDSEFRERLKSIVTETMKDYTSTHEISPCVMREVVKSSTVKCTDEFIYRFYVLIKITAKKEETTKEVKVMPDTTARLVDIGKSLEEINDMIKAKNAKDIAVTRIYMDIAQRFVDKFCETHKPPTLDDIHIHEDGVVRLDVEQIMHHSDKISIEFQALKMLNKSLLEKTIKSWLEDNYPEAKDVRVVTTAVTNVSNIEKEIEPTRLYTLSVDMTVELY